MSTWSEEEIQLLRKAVHEVPSSVEKQERFKQISLIVGTRGKRECYEQYKILKEAKAQRKNPSAIDGPAAAKKEVGNKLDSSADLLDDLLGELGVGESKSCAEAKEEAADAKATDPVGPRQNLDSKSSSREEQSTTVRLGRGLLRHAENDAKSDSTSSGRNGSSSSASAPRKSDAHAAAAGEKSVEGSAADVAEGGGWYGDDDGHGAVGEGGEASVQSRGALTVELANGLKDLLFNDRKKVFSDAWKKQGLFFASSLSGSAGARRGKPAGAKHGLGYGLEQRSGGPCGVIASVNAFVLRELLFPERGADGGPSADDWRNPTPSQQHSALVRSIAAMVLAVSSSPSAGGGGGGATSSGVKEVVVCLPLSAAGGSAQPLYRTAYYSPDGFTEHVAAFVVHVPVALSARGGGGGGGGGGSGRASSRANVVFESAIDTLARWLEPHMASSFEDPQGLGALLLLASVVLTRGLENVKSDMDEGFAGEVRTLLDRHGYMSQEGVNLLLLGRAHSNVFDGQKVLGDDSGAASGDAVTLKGVPRRGRVGFLSLQEAYRYFEVGERYKVPEVPVWVVYSESHYSVLFGATHGALSTASPGGSSHALGQKGGKGEDVDVYYWDMLAKQDEEIKLTLVAEHDENLPANDDDSALIPPLDLVCRTKWAGRLVDWNGYEPIL